jgi:bifunctional non-homologous end joining protein LigD
MLRQASFKGLREDKPAAEVRREKANPGSGTESSEGSSKADRTAKAKAKKETAHKAAATSVHSNIRLTHASKVIDHESGLTKQKLADYYEALADRILPHIEGRPLSIVRCPDGSTGTCFFQKHVKAGLPQGTGSVDVLDKRTGKLERYITLETRDGLVAMAQMNVLELHPWGSRNGRLEEPDRLIFDLDPDESLPWEVLAESAADVRKRLLKLGLKSFLKGTGGKGLHIVAPIDAEAAREWPVVKAFAHAFVQRMASDNPERYLTKMTKSARVGKIYLDYLRNERGATAVAPYSPRKRAGVPVSMPFAWSVLREAEMPRYRAADFEDWMRPLKADPWKELPKTQQRLTDQAISTIAESRARAASR